MAVPSLPLLGGAIIKSEAYMGQDPTLIFEGHESRLIKVADFQLRLIGVFASEKDVGRFNVSVQDPLLVQRVQRLR